MDFYFCVEDDDKGPVAQGFNAPHEFDALHEPNRRFAIIFVLPRISSLDALCEYTTGILAESCSKQTPLSMCENYVP